MASPEFTLETVQLGVLATESDMYRNYPTYQRRYRWPMRYRQALIDTVLREMPIPAPVVYREQSKQDGITRYFVIDGKQRIETLVGFLNNEFPTSGTLVFGDKPLEPRRYYKDLSAGAQNRMKSYLLRLQVWINYDEAVKGDVFRRMTNVLPLSQAEKIMTYSTEVNAYADGVASHSWLMSHMAPGEIDRSLNHIAALALMKLSVNRYADVMPGRLDTFASETDKQNGKDYPLDQMSKRSRRILDALNRVAATTQKASILDITALAMAIMTLDELGISLDLLPDDSLTPWVARARRKSIDANLFGLNSVNPRNDWSGIRSAANQRTFCNHFAPSLIELTSGKSQTKLVIVD